MNDFYYKHREPLLNKEHCDAQIQKLHDDIAFTRELFITHLNAEETRKDAWPAWNSMIAYDQWCLMVLNYSRGERLQALVEQFPSMLEAEERSHLPHPELPSYAFRLAERDTYPFVLSLLTFAKLLHHDALVPRVAALVDVDRTRNRGQDKLYETILHKLGLPAEPAEATFRHFKAHPLLLAAIEAPANKRPQLMKAFLKKWYPSMKGVIWHDKHRKNPLSFIGYWCWEAALVTYLWDMDDATYRNMPFYPKDLVDWARQ